MTETQLRERCRKALTEYRDHLQGVLDSGVIESHTTGQPKEKVRENALVSHTQVKSAMRTLWFEN